MDHLYDRKCNIVITFPVIVELQVTGSKVDEIEGAGPKYTGVLATESMEQEIVCTISVRFPSLVAYRREWVGIS